MFILQRKKFDSHFQNRYTENLFYFFNLKTNIFTFKFINFYVIFYVCRCQAEDASDLITVKLGYNEPGC